MGPQVKPSLRERSKNSYTSGKIPEGEGRRIFGRFPAMMKSYNLLTASTGTLPVGTFQTSYLAEENVAFWPANKL